MKQFYETYQANEKLAPVVREIPWTSNAMIFSSYQTKLPNKALLQAKWKEIINLLSPDIP